MSVQQLIYETVVPVSSGRHAKCAVEAGNSYAFTRNVNSVPLMAVEFPMAAPEYAIIFAGDGEAMMPAVILGARQKENLYLDSEDNWQAKYIPAFLRRYPFIFSSGNDGKTFTLCVDESFPGVNFQGKGRRLFGDDGKPSAYTETVLKFVESYRAQFLRTQAFCRKLKELDLLQPMQAEFTLSGGNKTSLSGFTVVSREKLKALSGDALSELVKNDGMELIYLHLYSMRNFEAVKDKLVQAGMEKTA
jgi:hypothetical protein